MHRDHEIRNAWIGPSFPLDLSVLPLRSDEIPLQYASLSKAPLCSSRQIRSLMPWIKQELGYSTTTPDFTLDERRKLGANVEELLKGEKEAARAPVDH